MKYNPREESVTHENYPKKDKITLVKASDSIAPYYDDALTRPKTSFLHIGNDVQLDRSEVGQLIKHLQTWVKLGTLDLTKHCYHLTDPTAPVRNGHCILCVPGRKSNG